MDLKLIESTIKSDLGFELYREQKSAIKNLVKGNFVEVKTGEGKSLINLVTACLLCKDYKNVYVISVNNYLANRDFRNFKNVIQDLGLSCSYNDLFDNCSIEGKKDIHSKNIIFTSTNELVFDYLRNCIGESDVSISLDCAIVDECDYVLLDNAQSEFSIGSGNMSLEDVPVWLYTICRKFCSTLNCGILMSKSDCQVSKDCDFDCIISKYESTSYLTELGIKKAKQFFGVNNLEVINGLLVAINDTLIAEFCYDCDVDYYIKEGKIFLIDANNGRSLTNSRKENGLQLALEIKENVNPSPWNYSSISISYQTFYNKFKFLCGISGTLFNTEDEVNTVYNKSVVRVKPHFQSKLEYRGFITSQDTEGKLYFTAKDIEGVNPRPVLVICGSDKEAREAHSYLMDNLKGKIVYYLDSKNVDTLEEEVVSKAGNINTVTISTFLSSRGVDIKISDEVNNMGGLHVISLGCFTNSRIDRQVRGRSARQGGSGSYSFIVSLKDNVFKFLDIRTMEKLQILKMESFYCKTWQTKLKRFCKSCQKSMCENLSHSRVTNYFLEKVLYAQKEELLLSLTESREDLFDLCNYFIENEMKNLNGKGTVNFLGFIVEDQNLEDIVWEVIIPKLKNTIFTCKNNRLKHIAYMSVYECFEDYKDKCYKQFYLLGDNITSASKFFELNKDLLFLYRRVVLYSFISNILNKETSYEK